MAENTQDIVGKRKIIHIDMDAFYASVEQRDNPELKGMPVIVGGLPERRGVVAACSYEARRFGIHSAMSSARARQLCHEAIFLTPRFPVYRQVSQEIHQIFHEVTELVEPLSLDEAYLDVSDNQDFGGSATLIAKAIKARIKEQTGLTASAGVSYNKFLAKVASDMDKPDGLYVITPEQGPAFVAELPIRKFHGIGKATEARMKAMGIHTGADLRARPLVELLHHFGKVGRFYYHIVRGIDNRPVNPHRIRKSLGSETTLLQDLLNRDEIASRLTEIAEKVAGLLKDKDLYARTVALKLKYSDFELITRSQTLPEPMHDAGTILNTVIALLDKTEVGSRPVRLVGITTSNFTELHAMEDEEQMELI